MSRTTMEITCHGDFEQTEKKIDSILSSNGYGQTVIKTGENVWKKGNGIMTAMQFIKIDYADAKVIVSAWVQVGIKDVGGEEMDLTGFVASIPKKQIMKILNILKREL